MAGEERQTQSGWILVSEVFETENPFFKSLYLWEGFDLSSNVYLIRTEKESAIIDPGNDYTAFYDLFFRSKLVKLTDIRKFLFTHGHSEHVVGFFELLRGYPSLRQQSGELQVYIHEASPEAFKELTSKLQCPINFIKDGDIINIGDFSLSVIHTPGHTMDSVCYWHEETKSLFSGDTALPYAVSSPDPVGGGRIDFYLFSMRILRSKGVRNLFPGHGDIIKDNGNLVINGNYGGLIKRVVGLQCPWLEATETLMKKGYLEEAIFCCDKVLEEDPKNISALYIKVCCLNDLAKFEESLKVIDIIEDIGNSTITNNPLFLIAKGYTLVGLGNYEKATYILDEALKMAPNLQNAAIYKGLALYLGGRVEEAMTIDAFREAFTSHFKEELLKHCKT